MNKLPKELKNKIEFDCCVFITSQKLKHIHNELLSEQPILCSYLNTTIDFEIEYYYADRLPALIECD